MILLKIFSNVRYLGNSSILIDNKKINSRKLQSDEDL